MPLRINLKVTFYYKPFLTNFLNIFTNAIVKLGIIELRLSSLHSRSARTVHTVYVTLSHYNRIV